MQKEVRLGAVFLLILLIHVYTAWSTQPHSGSVRRSKRTSSRRTAGGAHTGSGRVAKSTRRTTQPRSASQRKQHAATQTYNGPQTRSQTVAGYGNQIPTAIKPGTMTRQVGGQRGQFGVQGGPQYNRDEEDQIWGTHRQGTGRVIDGEWQVRAEHTGDLPLPNTGTNERYGLNAAQNRRWDEIQRSAAITQRNGGAYLSDEAFRKLGGLNTQIH